jgi:hypothetical protein
LHVNKKLACNLLPLPASVCIPGRAQSAAVHTREVPTCQCKAPALPFTESPVAPSPSPVFAPPLQLIPSRKTLTSSYSSNRQTADFLRPPFSSVRVKSLRVFLFFSFSCFFNPHHPFVHRPSASVSIPAIARCREPQLGLSPSTLASLARSLFPTPLATRPHRQVSARILVSRKRINTKPSHFVYPLDSAFCRLRARYLAFFRGLACFD